MELICAGCKKDFELPDWRYRSKVKAGQTRFFCSPACALPTVNRAKRKPRSRKYRVCPGCQIRFAPKGQKVYCTASCGARSTHQPSIEQARQAGLNLSLHRCTSAPETRRLQLIVRTEWRMRDTLDALRAAGFHVEQFGIRAGRIWDLVLEEQKILVDLHGRKQDGPEPDRYGRGRQAGYRIVPVRCDPAKAVPPESVLAALAILE